MRKFIGRVISSIRLSAEVRKKVQAFRHARWFLRSAAQCICQSWGETMPYSKNQIYIHRCTWILSLTDVYLASSSFLFLVRVIPLLY